MEILDKLEKIYIPKTFLNKLISKKYSRVIYKITLMLWQLTDKKYPFIEVTISEIAYFANISKSNVRSALDKMAEMKLIKYKDTPLGLYIELLHMLEKDYVKIPLLLLQSDFLDMPLISQRICLYVVLHGYEISSGNGKNIFKQDMIKLFGDTNLWRIDKYFKQAEAYMHIKSEKTWVRIDSDDYDTYEIKTGYTVTMGECKALIDIFNKDKSNISNQKDQLRLSYIKFILNKKCDYDISAQDASNWLKIYSDRGQITFLKTSEIIGKNKSILNMIKYFSKTAKRISGSFVAA